ncbi:MAG: hypothetical protein IPF53_02880 [Blastocatellia bacterium]|nr:hypothetical protein [Blastocatellia bacterium]MBK6428524.1 hypothetical protein [Blastocatellia bacterium]
MKIKTLSGALFLMMTAVSPGLSQDSRPTDAAPAPAPAPAIAGSSVAAPAPVAEPSPVAVVAAVETQELPQAPAPGDAPDPVVAPDGPPRAGATPPPGAPRSPRAGRPGPPGRPGQAVPPDGPLQPGPAMAPPADRQVFVEDSGMKNQIFEVRHRDPVRLEEVLQALGSGRRGAVIDASRDFKTLTVRDFPENLATIEAAIKRLDVPAPPASDIDIRLFVVLASQTPDGADADLPPEIRGAAQQLRTAFGYKGFRLLTPIMQRSREGHAPTRGSGEISGATLGSLAEPNSGLRYGYEIRSIARTSEPGGAIKIDLTGFEFEMSGRLGNARIASSLSINPGEQVIVGSASLNRTALILILSATVVK